MTEEKYFHYLSADKETQISAKIWMPSEEKPQAVLQLAHGMVEYKERYDRFAKFLTEQGFIVCANDHLGHGDSVKTTDDWGYMTPYNPSDVIIKDMHSLRSMMQKQYPDLPYYMLGHSMGSYMLRKYLAVHGQGLAGAVIMGTGHAPAIVGKLALFLTNREAKKHGWRYRSEFIQGLTYDKNYKKYDLTGKNTKNSWLTRDEEIVKKYYSDPKCTYTFTLTGHKGLFEAVLFDCKKENIERIPSDLPILLISGEDDPVGGLGKGVRKVEALLRDTGHTDVVCKLYPGARHEVLNEINYEEVYGDILAWLTKK